MNKYKILALGVMAVAALALPSQGAISKGIEGSVHDFSTNSWNLTRAGVCSPCHAAHHTDENQIAPLWTHETSTASFTAYGSDSSTLDAAVGAPSGPSLACLSCHDGTLAINQGIGAVTNASSQFIDAGAQIGPDLHNTHPVSFTYDSALATADGGLEDPSVYTIGSPKDATKLTITTAPVPASWSGTSLTGKTIDEALLFNGKMECSSCHDVHKMEGSSPESGILARISGKDANNRGSTLCRTCHIK